MQEPKRHQEPGKCWLVRETPSPLPAAGFLEDTGLGGSQGAAIEEHRVRRLGSHFPHQDNEWFPKSQDSLVNLVLSFLGTVQGRGGAATTAHQVSWLCPNP